mmetsp:Transcript_78329/g.226483  ORF Transcript_78329/g.226483 Transcript_78329/m.226483 type:complete len:235 (+) Transcript_78329:1-705(+)
MFSKFVVHDCCSSRQAEPLGSRPAHCRDGCNRTSMALFCAAVSTLLAGLSVALAGVFRAPSATLDVEDERSFMIDMPMADECGYILYVRASDDCHNALAGLSVTSRLGAQDAIVEDRCGEPALFAAWQNDYDPPLQPFVQISKGFDYSEGAKISGEYVVACDTVGVWAWDLCTDDIGGLDSLITAMGLWILAAFLEIFSCCLCFAGCCCMTKPEIQSAPTKRVVRAPCKVGIAV